MSLFLIITSLLLLFLSSPSFSDAFEAAVLKSADIKPYEDVLEGFKRSCDCNESVFLLSEIRNRDIQNTILRKNPDVILTIGIEAFKYAKKIKDIPVIYTMIPFHHFHITGQKKISGVCMFIQPERQIDTILEVFPDTKRIGLIYDPGNTEEFVHEALGTAKSKKIKLVAIKTFKAKDVPSIIESMKDKIDVFWMLPDTTIVNSETIDAILLFSFRNKIPTFTFSKKYVEMGATAALGIDPSDMGIQAGEIAKKLFTEGTAQGHILSHPRKRVLIINQKIAKKLGLKIREEILRKADVYE
jgi:putative ABC transport system substrate-binding protein